MRSRERTFLVGILLPHHGLLDGLLRDTRDNLNMLALLKQITSCDSSAPTLMDHTVTRLSRASSALAEANESEIDARLRSDHYRAEWGYSDARLIERLFIKALGKRG